MRAALGLPSVDELSANLYVEQQQRLEQQHRDIRYRNALYQDQLDHQLHELQMRANAVAELEQLPDLQQHYASLLLKERIARGAEQVEQQAAAAAYRARQAAAVAQEQQYAAAAAAAGATSVPQSAHAAFAHPTHHASVQAAAQAQLRYQEELRHQQQQQQQHNQQQQTAALHAHLRGSGPMSSLDLVLRNAGVGPGAVPAPPPQPHAVAPVPSAAVAGRNSTTSPPIAPGIAVAAAAVAATSESVGSVSEETAERLPLSRKNSVDSVELEDYVIAQHQKQGPDSRPSGKKEKGKSSRASAADGDQKLPGKRKRGRPRKPADSITSIKAAKKKKEVVDEEEQRMRAEAILQAMAERAAGMKTENDAPGLPDGMHTGESNGSTTMNERVEIVIDDNSEGKMEGSIPPLSGGTGASALLSLAPGSTVASASRKDGKHAPVRRIDEGSSGLGTVVELLAAANSEEKAFEAAHVLQFLKDKQWTEDEEKEDKAPTKPSPEDGHPPHDRPPAQSIVTSMLESHFPSLPEEPVLNEEIGVSHGNAFLGEQEDVVVIENQKGDEHAENEDQTGQQDENQMMGKVGVKEGRQETQKRKSNVLDYPYPVDTWWPSTAGRRRERRHAGETSDEDAFEDPRDLLLKSNPKCLRVNEKKIDERLDTELEPGVLEKIPHCRLHRLKRKNVGSLAELVYCFQVTECYPGEMMVCCSICGTWRHAVCGGHFEPYSVRKNANEPFVAICEQCHQEKEIIKEYPMAKARIERQRMEQLRRGLSTTAVMRSMSFSKHGGTYKWPLGSVSATHVGGHTRSVQARHDKAEKQWADLLTRLGRGYGYRTKERQRVRTKELERLLVAVEDAEGQTDRHNMLLFLLRDTKRPVPVGFEEEYKNLFDPCYTDEEFDSFGFSPSIRRLDSHKQTKETSDGNDESSKLTCKKCIREDCNKNARFDSRFCSDACGVHVLELDLLQAFYESNDIHPSVLRSHY